LFSRRPSAAPVFPSCVAAPTARTLAVPVPRTTSVPEYSTVASSGADPPAARLRIGTDSPVSNDSSTSRFDEEIRATSAGTRSPSCTTTRSPRTSSRAAMRTRAPLRITSARGLERSRSASSARSVLCSWYKVTPITKRTAISSATASCGSPRAR
jgi:hypothetical protein